MLPPSRAMVGDEGVDEPAVAHGRPVHVDEPFATASACPTGAPRPAPTFASITGPAAFAASQMNFRPTTLPALLATPVDRVRVHLRVDERRPAHAPATDLSSRPATDPEDQNGRHPTGVARLDAGQDVVRPSPPHEQIVDLVRSTTVSRCRMAPMKRSRPMTRIGAVMATATQSVEM